MKTNEIDCTVADNKLFDLGEPCAYFSAKFPKEAKTLKNQTSKERVILMPVCLQPSLNKIIASDTKILTAMNVDCVGYWPENIDGKPFECFINPKAISALAGKTVDIAMWQDESARHYITCCETTGVRTQYQLTGAKYVDWQRVINKTYSEDKNICIAQKDISALQNFIKKNIGKTKKEQRVRVVSLMYTAGADSLNVRIAEQQQEYNLNAEIIAENSFTLELPFQHDFHVVYSAQQFFYAVQGDFNGNIWFADHNNASKFIGAIRQSLLMPINVRPNNTDLYFN